MKAGVVFPQTEIGDDVAVIRDYTQTVEGLGFDFLLAYDHVLGANPDREGGWRGPYTHIDMFHEPFTLFSYLAAITETLEFTTGILVLPQRQTALVAKQAAQLDILSRGRLRLGVGIGWNWVEFQGLGEDFSTRGKRSEEQIKLLRLLWNEPLVKFEGQFHSFDNVGISPLPKRRIPIWFGGSADVVLDRMARLGDGWIANPMPIEKMKPYLEKLSQYLAQANRTFDDFGLDMRIGVRQHGPDTWDRLLAEYQSIGTTHISIATGGMGFTTIDEHLTVIRRFKEHLDG
ncbi:MAG: LLM class F420-dependent oxidoreductase [Chloroflexi bacterium]|nr:LLM class F420-dependent oxidoreductase [Chloroflexota bacterium]